MTSALTRVTVRPDSTVADPLSPGVYILGSQGQQPCPTPADTLDCMPSDHYWHSIGTVRVGPDGRHAVGRLRRRATPVDRDPTSFRPYDETNTAGKILHIDKAGRGLPGHPFCPGVTDLTRTCTKVYAKGFRNPFRFTLRPGKGPVVGDVGQGAFEEIDLIQPGAQLRLALLRGPARNGVSRSTSTCQNDLRAGGHRRRRHPARRGATPRRRRRGDRRDLPTAAPPIRRTCAVTSSSPTTCRAG